MSQIMKAFTGIFMVMFMMTAAVGILGAFFQTLYAQNLHASIVDEMENSDYASPVIEACFRSALKSGYELEVTLYSDYEGVNKCHGIEEVPSDTSHITMAEVVLSYPIKIAFFELNMEQKIYGYAR